MVTGGTAMKTMKFALLAVAAMVAASCVKENPENQTAPIGKPVKMEFSAQIEPLTKTELENGNTIRWYSNEAINVFDNASVPLNEHHNNEFTNISGAGNVSATFKGEVPEGATEYYAFYPSRSAAYIDGSTIKGCFLAPNQSATPNTFATKLGAMMAKADENNSFAFKNVLSHIRFTLPDEFVGKVKSLTLMGNNDEVIAGNYEVDWNNGDPVVTCTGPEIYVRLSRNDNNLTEGDYYFTVLPVEFTKGFTVIVSMLDGTQVAIRTDKPVTGVSTRNQILPMKAVESSRFTAHMNPFIQYLNGYNVKIGDLTINQETHGKNYTLVSDAMENTDIKKDGIYFVTPNTKTAALNYTSVKNLIIMGTDSLQRTPMVAPTGNVALADGSSYYAFANLDFESVPVKLIYVTGGTFGDIVLKNCHFGNMGGNLLDFNKTTHAVETVNSIVLEDSEFGFGTESLRLIVSQGIEGSLFKNIKLHNNVFYVVDGITPTETRLIFFNNGGSKGGCIGNDSFTGGTFTMTNNTFAIHTLVQAAFCPFTYVKDATIDISRNLFTLTINRSSGINVATRQSAGGEPTSAVFRDNYFFETGTSEQNLAVSNFTDDDAIPKLSVDPLNSTLWDPAKGSFGAYTITPADGPAVPTGVLIGAQRADMTAESAAINSAAANYASVDLGVF